MSNFKNFFIFVLSFLTVFLFFNLNQVLKKLQETEADLRVVQKTLEYSTQYIIRLETKMSERGFEKDK